MQNVERTVGQASVVDANATDQRSAVNDGRTRTEAPVNVLIIRDAVLRKLSNAAREALAGAGRADNK